MDMKKAAMFPQDEDPSNRGRMGAMKSNPPPGRGEYGEKN
jgi:hypothetical protein